MPQPMLNLGSLSESNKETIVRKDGESEFDHAMALQEEPVQITFLMPDDTTISKEFKKGHTVALLKALLEDENDLKQEETQLVINGAVLLDPLTLTDFPCILKASTIVMRCILTR